MLAVRFKAQSLVNTEKHEKKKKQKPKANNSCAMNDRDENQYVHWMCVFFQQIWEMGLQLKGKQIGFILIRLGVFPHELRMVSPVYTLHNVRRTTFNWRIRGISYSLWFVPGK